MYKRLYYHNDIRSIRCHQFRFPIDQTGFHASCHYLGHIFFQVSIYHMVHSGIFNPCEFDSIHFIHSVIHYALTYGSLVYTQVIWMNCSDVYRYIYVQHYIYLCVYIVSIDMHMTLCVFVCAYIDYVYNRCGRCFNWSHANFLRKMISMLTCALSCSDGLGWWWKTTGSTSMISSHETWMWFWIHQVTLALLVVCKSWSKRNLFFFANVGWVAAAGELGGELEDHPSGCKWWLDHPHL